MTVSSRRLLARPLRRPVCGRPPSAPAGLSGAQMEPVEARRLLSSTVIFSDGFEGSGSTPAGWTVVTHSGGGASPNWGANDVKAFAGARSAFSGGPGRDAYSNDQHTGLVRKRVSLAGYNSATLSFKYYLNTEAGYDYFTVDVVAAGTTRSVFRDSGDDRSAGWQSKSVDLSAYAGRTNLDVEFRFDSDHSVTRAAPSGVWVDDVRLTADNKSSTGTVRGVLFDDADGDRTRDAGEAPLSGWVVYLDRNQNHRRDSGEWWRTTDASGRYSFGGVAPGTHYVASEMKSGYVQTAPAAADVRAAGEFDVTLHFDDPALSSSRRDAFRAAARRWERVIVGDLPDVRDDGLTIDDILIEAAVTEVDGPGGVLAQSSPSAMRDPAAGGARSGLPYRGFVEIDAADLAALERNGTLLEVVTHEMAHALGLGTLWEENGLLKNPGSNDPRFTGPVAVAQYNAVFDASATSVPVEGDGAPGTRDSHWRESTFGDELMTGYIDRPPDPISRVTVGSLADLGYVVDLSAADAYVPPGGHPMPAPAGVERAVTVAAGQTRSGVDFGARRSNRAPSVASLAVVPNPAAAGATITLKATGVSDRDGSVAKVGFYRETNGKAGVQFGSGGDQLLATDAKPGDGFTATVSTAPLAPGTYTYYAVAVDDQGASSAGGTAAPSATHALQSAARIAGIVFRDADGDGTRDASDGALPGCRVYLDANGNDRFDTGERSVLSDGGGAYGFTGLTAGDYTVRCVPPSGYVRTAPSAGEYGLKVGAGESITGRNFGAAAEARITGRVFNDPDADGVKDALEAGLSGWRVFVDNNANGLFDSGEVSTLTGSNGTYTLAGLRPGKYTVRLLVLSGWKIVSPSGGRYTGVDLAAGQTGSAKNFGVVELA